MKATALDGIPDLPGLFSVSLYDMKPVHFLSICFDAMKWVHKTCQLYGPK